ncbi:MAG: transposase [Pyrinomonadaceae bacterium]|nr:transposase [Pyrinomonadaceae bacterium]
MKLFKSKEPNIFHYVTAVTHKRLPIFRNEKACQIFIDTLVELKSIHPFKLIGYVIMPDHFHLIFNPIESDVSVILRKLKGKSAKLILDWLEEEGHDTSLRKLELNIKGRRHAVWLKDSSAIDLFSHKFLRQKLRYIHLNPVEAGLCSEPKDWKWSSFCAYFPKYGGDVPVGIDLQAYWNEEELLGYAVAAGCSL